MLIKKILVIVLFVLLNLKMQAQEMQYSQYQHTPFSTNSGILGSSNDMQLTLNYRNQPLVSGDKIATTTVSASYPLLSATGKRYGGLGIAFMNDNAASFLKTTNIFLGGAYNFNIGSTQLSWGLQGGYGQKRFDADGLVTSSQLNNGIPNGSGGENFNATTKGYALISSGLYWYKEDVNNTKLYFVGLNASNVNKADVVFTSGIKNNIPATLTAIAGVRAFQNSKFTVFPNVRIVNTTGNIIANAGAWTGYKLTKKNKITIGTLYNTNKVLNFSIEYTAASFFINAGYDYALINSTKLWQGNSTEIHFGYKKTITRGVKDMDKDGIPDKTDECASEPGLKKFNGCPDTDNDGVPDKEDECPSIAGNVALHGCPDKDGDGVSDSKDECIAEAGPKELNGCPDKDNDGIPDKADQCPDEAGTKEQNGCKEIKAGKTIERSELKQKPLDNLADSISNVSVGQIAFETNEAVLKESSSVFLQDIIHQLKKNGDSKIVLEGHADSDGPEKFNLTLSLQRAEAVAQYFINYGIQPDRILVEAFGENKPVSPNNTKEGKQNNRCVKIKIIKSY